MQLGTEISVRGNNTRKREISHFADFVRNDGRVGVSGELRQVIKKAAADFAVENFGHAGDGTGRLVERDALDASHGEEDGGKADAFCVELIDFADKMIEGVEINAADGDAAGVRRSRSMPQTFSLGECRLTMMMELGFMALRLSRTFLEFTAGRECTAEI